MHIILSLLVGLAFATPTLPNDELGRALTNLNAKVTVVDHSRLQQVNGWGAWLSLNAIYFAGAVAIASVVPPNATEAQAAVSAAVIDGQKALLRGAVIAVNVGGIMWLISWVGKKLRPAPSPKALFEYQSPDGVNEFFRLRLEDQYTLARNDPHFTDFLITLSRAHDFVARPDPSPRVPDGSTDAARP